MCKSAIVRQSGGAGVLWSPNEKNAFAAAKDHGEQEQHDCAGQKGVDERRVLVGFLHVSLSVFEFLQVQSLVLFVRTKMFRPIAHFLPFRFRYHPSKQIFSAPPIIAPSTPTDSAPKSDVARTHPRTAPMLLRAQSVAIYVTTSSSGVGVRMWLTSSLAVRQPQILPSMSAPVNEVMNSILIAFLSGFVGEQASRSAPN